MLCCTLHQCSDTHMFRVLALFPSLILISRFLYELSYCIHDLGSELSCQQFLEGMTHFSASSRGQLLAINSAETQTAVIGCEPQEQEVTWWKYKAGRTGTNCVSTCRVAECWRCLEELFDASKYETGGSGCGMRTDRRSGQGECSCAGTRRLTEDTWNRWETQSDKFKLEVMDKSPKVFNTV